MILGLGIAMFSNKIVSPGLERLLGIEVLVGKANVVYLDTGGYMYTNPGAITRWIVSVAAIGLLMSATGFILLRKIQKE